MDQQDILKRYEKGERDFPQIEMQKSDFSERDQIAAR